MPIVACSGGSTGALGDAGAGDNGSSDHGGDGQGPSGTPTTSSQPTSSTSSAPPAGSGPPGAGGGGGGGSIVCGNAESSDFCYCQRYAQPQPSTPCNAAGVGSNAGCCADVGWPSSGSCQCTRYTCETAGDGCNCWYHGGGPGVQTTCAPKAGQVCCVSEVSSLGNLCTCRTGTSCGSGKQVSSCTKESTGCLSTQTSLPACG